jgi:NAD(P)-dependent dehydrogenase (short-subunit alcohol dehydrogenase family)
MAQLTKHGHDLQFGTNTLGHFYLTQLLLPTLISSAKESIDGTGKTRVVNVSSSGHWFAPTPKQGGPIILDSLIDGPKRNTFTTQDMYFQSKAVSHVETPITVSN